MVDWVNFERIRLYHLGSLVLRPSVGLHMRVNLFFARAYTEIKYSSEGL